MGLDSQGLGKELLVVLGDWEVCKWTDENGVQVYAEHQHGCHKKPDKDQAHWGWEWDDDEPKCWICDAPCTDEVMGLVLLYNFDRVKEVT